MAERDEQRGPSSESHHRLPSSAAARLTAMRSGGPKTDRGGVRLADFLHANVRGFAALRDYFGGTGQAKLCPHCWQVTIISCRPSTAWIGNLLARWAPIGHGMLTMLSQRSFQLPQMRSTPQAIATLCHHVVERASDVEGCHQAPLLMRWCPNCGGNSGAASGHSMTWSARSSIVCGIVRPSALAVLRLMVSANLVGCSTGRSAGFAPLRILMS